MPTGPHRILLRWTWLAIGGALATPAEAKIDSQWLELPPLPTARQEVGVAAEGAHVYVIGGILADRSPTGLVERFDTELGEWQAVASLPDGVQVHHVGAASALGKVFAIGGLDAGFRGTRGVFAYTPAESSWERKSDLPAPRGAMGIAVIGDLIYAAGGQDGDPSFADFFVYHAAEDRWENLPAMPTARNHLAAASLDGIFYAVGGRAGRLFDKLEAYDPASRRWLELAPMPTARGGIAAAAASGCIFVFGGEGNSADPGGVFRQVEGFFACTGAWMLDLDMPHPRHGTGAAEVRGVLYVPGGSPVDGYGVTDVHDAFQPGTGPGGFLRGDENRDGRVDISDAVGILAVLFLGDPPFRCADAADSDDNGRLDLTDAVYVLSFLFLGGRPTPAPGVVSPGADPTDDAITCLEPPGPRCSDPFER